MVDERGIANMVDRAENLLMLVFPEGRAIKAFNAGRTEQQMLSENAVENFIFGSLR